MKPFKRGLGSWGIGVTAFCVAAAGASPVWSENLHDIYQQSLKNDPAYLAGLHQYESNGESYYQARAGLLPSISLSASHTKSKQKIVSSDNQVFAKGSTSFPTKEYTLSIRQSIYSYSNWSRLRQSEAQTERANSERMALEQDLLLKTAERYFAALAVLEDAGHIHSEQKAVENLYELVKAKRNDGLARETDLLDAQARFLQMTSRRIEMRTRIKDSIQLLSEMTGTEPQRLAVLGNQLKTVRPEPVNAEQWFSTALKHNPELDIRHFAVEAAREEVKALKGDHYPTLDLELRHNDRDTKGTLFGGGSQVKSDDVVLSVSLPIYSGGLTSSRVREATSQLSKTMQELELEQRAVKRKTLSAYDGILTDIAKIEALKKAVESYELAAESKRLEYESGLSTSVAILDAESDLFKARSEYTRARYGYILNSLRLKRSVGVLSENDLVQVNEMLGRQKSVSHL